MTAPRTYGRIEDAGEGWRIAGVEPHVSIRLKAIFASIPKAATPPFKVAKSDAAAADLVWFVERYPMAMPDSVRRELRRRRGRHAADAAEVGRILMPDWQGAEGIAIDGFVEGRALRDYQKVPVAFRRVSPSFLLGDAIGVGKTIEAFGMMLDAGAPFAVVVQPHVSEQWMRRFGEFTGLDVHEVKTRKPYSLPKADGYLFRYSNVGAWADVVAAMGFSLVVFDEIQELRAGTETEKGQGCMALSLSARSRVGMSATPIYNYGAEIHAIYGFLPDAQGLNPLGTLDEFRTAWCTRDKIVLDPEALHAMLVDRGLFLRRTRADVGRELPESDPVVIDVEHDESEERRMEALAEALAIKAVSGSFMERGRAARDLDALMRLSTGVAKARSVAAQIRIFLEAGEKVLCGVWHREVYDILMRELQEFNPVMFSGSESVVQKNRAVERFTAGDSRIMLMSLRSGAGLDGLQGHCSVVAAAELDWSPEVHKQFVGRLLRDGMDETKGVLSVFFVSNFGSDPSIIEVLGVKSDQSSGIVDGERRHSFERDAAIREAGEGRLKALAEAFLARRGIVVREREPEPA